jgi:hypothetical protein
MALAELLASLPGLPVGASRQRHAVSSLQGVLLLGSGDLDPTRAEEILRKSIEKPRKPRGGTWGWSEKAIRGRREA